MEKDNRPRSRILLILNDLIESPFVYTKADLVQRCNTSLSTIKRDLKELENARFNVAIDDKNRHAVLPTKALENLQNILYLTDKEYAIVADRLQDGMLPAKQKALILKKLKNVFDLTKYGSMAYSNAYLQKLDILYASRRDKQKVILSKYKSAATSAETDRTVEVFNILPKEDTIHAFDYKKGKAITLKITRFEGVFQLDDDWENEEKHHFERMDVLNYESKEQAKVCIRMDTSGYVRFIERFPKAKIYCRKNPADPNIMEFEAEVNSKFQGLSSFLIGEYDHINEIVEPYELIEHLNEKIKKMQF